MASRLTSGCCSHHHHRHHLLKMSSNHKPFQRITLYKIFKTSFSLSSYIPPPPSLGLKATTRVQTNSTSSRIFFYWRYLCQMYGKYEQKRTAITRVKRETCSCTIEGKQQRTMFCSKHCSMLSTILCKGR